ncbi:MAG: hypothetical protein LBD05_02035 [Mycoplasmataceae bacterium]|jgi:F-type H+-transporting ATPase subunit b|nr:hypothetical protein [Mycoplasmataceae bacterium]
MFLKKIFKLFCCALIILNSIIVISSCSPINSDDITNSLIPDLWIFITNIIACCFTFLITLYLLWKPTKKFLNKKQEYIANEISTAEKKNIELTTKLLECAEIKKKSREEAKKIIANAIEESNKIYSNSKARTLKELEEIKKNNDDEANKIKSNIYKNYENDVVQLASTIAETFLHKKISKKNNNAFVDEIVNIINENNIENDDNL